MSAGIETTYKSIRFRSRAEARWAAFFDLCGWDWSYEPIDLAGYIPDFILHMNIDVLVEVKGGALGADELRPHIAKIERSGWRGEALLLPAALREDDSTFTGAVSALLTDNCHKDGDDDEFPPPWWWEHACIGWCGLHKGIGLSHSVGFYTCRACGKNDGNPTTYMRGDPVDVFDLWARAQNVTRWQ